eukprot:CAMPEP_0172055948 /NCGR_PEP_ID=MMETSP1043-20130122/5534_1 /TAXON_ID=464988 /ORGANISM="Hemiselmis andersenii, Strain CCMP441" /LENGTH=321 /DNA_ID=CAMNT_0012715343 /DNA_START=40 /DNA_END=1002 /DNA_ORIENTATION=+
MTGGGSGVQHEGDSLLQTVTADAAREWGGEARTQALGGSTEGGDGGTVLVQRNLTYLDMSEVVEVSCKDSIADGRAGCLTPECEKDRGRFHLPVGTIVTVHCPAKCSGYFESEIWGPGDGTMSTERCSGYKAGTPALFSDESSICRTAIAMRALGQLSPGLVTFRIAEPIPSYPRCDKMPHDAPGLPFGHIFKAPDRLEFLATVSSHSRQSYEWKKADRPAKIDRWGGPDQCCFDEPAPSVGTRAEPCCAIQKYRQQFHPTPYGHGYWVGVRSLEVLPGLSQTNVGLIVDETGGEELTEMSGYAASPGGSDELAKTVRRGL